MYGFKKIVFCVFVLAFVVSSFSVYAEDIPADSSMVTDVLSGDSANNFIDSSNTFIARLRSIFSDLSTFTSQFQEFIKSAISFIPFSYWFIFILIIVNAIFLSVYKMLR